MEFFNLGERCDLEGCRQLDFLPFKCEGCHHSYCLEHRTAAGHHCSTPPAIRKDTPATAQVASCPVCDVVVVLSASESQTITLDAKMDDHLNKGCKAEAQRRKAEKQKKACSHDKCKKVDLVPTQCKGCLKTFCLKHRFPHDHQCQNLVAPARDKDPRLTNPQTRNSRLLVSVH